MKADDFRRIALSMPGASESAHMGHPDFRVGGKIFATLHYPNEESGVIMLPPDEQQRLVRAYRAIFIPAKGAWGRQGSTQVNLEAVDTATLQSAMVLAWRKKAPARLVTTGKQRLFTEPRWRFSKVNMTKPRDGLRPVRGNMRTTRRSSLDGSAGTERRSQAAARDCLGLFDSIAYP